MAYADWTYYSGTYGGSAGRSEITGKLEAATDAIDAVTFSRIVAIGWDNLSAFQQGLIMRACCLQADFLLENADAVESAMSEYSINGVTMRFGNPALYTVQNGIPMENAAFALLKRTGLTALLAYPSEADRALA